MSKHRNSTATTINVTGKVTDKFDTARFQVNASMAAKSGPEAKEKILPTVRKLDEYYQSLASKSLAEKLKTSLHVQPHYVYDKTSNGNKLTGYVAVYSLSFHTSNIDEVTNIQDMLTSMENVQVSPPSFDVKNKAELSNKALKLAFEKAQKRLAEQCEVLGVNVKNLEIVSWNVTYSEDRNNHHMEAMSFVGAGVRAAVNSPEPQFQINPGKAEVTCSLSVVYGRN
jgi:uncharacterized protein YggE